MKPLTSSNEETVYVQLLNEGTTVYRPAPAVFIGPNIAKLLLHDEYDPYDEEWEFKPGCVVRVETKELQGGPVPVAIALIDDRQRDEEWRRLEEKSVAVYGEESQYPSLLLIYGGLGICGYLSRDGEVFVEDFFEKTPPVRASFEQRTRILVAASRKLDSPYLRTLLPEQPGGSSTCVLCDGSGWMAYGGMDMKNKGPQVLVCSECNGLGWIWNRP